MLQIVECFWQRAERQRVQRSVAALDETNLLEVSKIRFAVVDIRDEITNP